MIKANELRIGNMLEYFIDEGWERTIIDWQDLKRITEYPTKFNYYHRPIPITDELLLECGCILIYKSDCSIILTLSDKHDISIKWSKVLGWRFVLNGFVKQFDYFHQLQNLYFTLTGEDLIINTQYNESRI